jgi:uncharacterized protein YggE
MRFAQLAALAALVAAVAALAGVGRPGAAHGSNTPAGRVITVTGTGMASAVPNEATFSFGVQTDGTTARDAQAANAERMSRVVAALRDLGIAKADLQTTDVSVSPEWSSDGSVRGYTAHNSLQVKVHRVSRAGHVVDVAVGAGATESSGPTFSRADHALLYKAALRNAVTQARSKAEALASESGVQLGGVNRVEEQSAQPQPVYDYATALRAAAPTPVEPGTQKTQATVRVTFSLA